VDFPQGYDLFQQRLPLAEQLQKLLARPVEVIPEHELNRYIREKALKEAVVCEPSLVICSECHHLDSAQINSFAHV